MRHESLTPLPPEVVGYAEREHPETAIGEFIERALRRVGNSSVVEQKRFLVAIGVWAGENPDVFVSMRDKNSFNAVSSDRTRSADDNWYGVRSRR